LEAREPLEEITSQLDEMLRISFETSFSFSLSSIIFKGMRHTTLKGSAEAALRTLLRVTSRAHNANLGIYNGYKDCPSPEALGYFLALLPVSTTPKSYCRLLNECSIDDSWVSDGGHSDSEEEELGIPRITDVVLGVHDVNTALLVASFAGTILGTAQGDDAETQMLYGLLSSLANTYPEIISITYVSILPNIFQSFLISTLCRYDTMQDRIKDTFANSSNAAIIRSVSNIFRVALQDTTKFSNTSTLHSSTSTLSTVDENSIGPGRSHLNALDELAMQGLANNLTFLPPNRGHATKMINWIPTLVSLMISS
jgi:hypothetical protein